MSCLIRRHKRGVAIAEQLFERKAKRLCYSSDMQSKINSEFLKDMRAGFLCLQDVYMPKIWIHHSAADSSWGASASIKTQGVKTYNLCFYSKIMWVIASLEAVTSRYSLEMEADFTAFRCGWGYCDPVLVPSLRTTCWLPSKTPSQENALHKNT